MLLRSPVIEPASINVRRYFRKCEAAWHSLHHRLPMFWNAVLAICTARLSISANPQKASALSKDGLPRLSAFVPQHAAQFEDDSSNLVPPRAHMGSGKRTLFPNRIHRKAHLHV
jgi:hypothetical protein